MWITTFEMTFVPEDIAPAQSFREFALSVYTELGSLNGFSDPEMHGRFSDHELALTITVPCEQRADATEVASTAFRSALHAAGAHTPDWDTMVAAAVDRANVTSRHLQPA